MPINSIIFDLDETLIHGIFHKDGRISLKIRPYCIDLMKYVFDNFNVGIWTMANVSWCDTVLEHILTKEQQKKLVFIYTSQNACPRMDGDIKCLDKIYKKKNYKDIFNSENTLIVDDKFHNMRENTINGIHIPEFKGNSNDDSLLKLMEHLKKYKNRDSSKFPKNIKW